MRQESVTWPMHFRSSTNEQGKRCKVCRTCTADYHILLQPCPDYGATVWLYENASRLFRSQDKLYRERRFMGRSQILRIFSYIESLRNRIKELEAHSKLDANNGASIDTDCQTTLPSANQASSPPTQIPLDDMEVPLLTHVNQKSEKCVRFGRASPTRLDISGDQYSASNPQSTPQLVDSLRSHGPNNHHVNDLESGHRAGDIEMTIDEATKCPIGISPTESAYFGSSSSFSFMDEVQSVLNISESWRPEEDCEEPMCNAPRNIRDDPRPSSIMCPATGDSYRWRQQARSVFEDFTLPRRADADALVETYFVWTHNLYPFLEELWFRQRYEQLWTTSDDQHQCKGFQQSKTKSRWATRQDPSANDGILGTDDILFYCLANVVFAMGCQFHSDIDPRDRRRESEIFYQRAKRLLGLDFDLMNEGSTLLVQTFLIMGHYLQSTEMIGACWNCVGVAIRAAQAIGLHLDPSRQFKLKSLDQAEYDLRLRLWGGCLLFDRSVFFGSGFSDRFGIRGTDIQIIVNVVLSWTFFLTGMFGTGWLTFIL